MLAHTHAQAVPPTSNQQEPLPPLDSQQSQQQPSIEQPLPANEGLLRLLKPLQRIGMHVPQQVYERESVVTNPTLHADLLPEKDVGTLRGGR